MRQQFLCTATTNFPAARNLVKLFKGNLKEISQFFEGNFGQNKEKKRIFLFFKVEALDTCRLDGTEVNTSQAA